MRRREQTLYAAPPSVALCGGGRLRYDGVGKINRGKRLRRIKRQALPLLRNGGFLRRRHADKLQPPRGGLAVYDRFRPGVRAVGFIE